MIEQRYDEIVNDELLKDSLDHNAHTGFLEDYRVLTCLLRIHKPKSIFEVGTNVGSGINVMHKALPDAKIFSLDLDFETMKLDSKQYPVGSDGEDRVGSACNSPYTQLRGDSLTFDYSQYPCEAYFIDGEHDYKHPYVEAKKAILNMAKLIIFHDADVNEVYNAILDAFSWTADYKLYRVVNTRIAYAVRNSNNNI